MYNTVKWIYLYFYVWNTQKPSWIIPIISKNPSVYCKQNPTAIAGLSAIHRLTARGSTLRLEMKLFNGSDLFAEYSGFRVGSSETNYTMNYDRRVRCSPGLKSDDALDYHRGMQFSTKDRDHDTAGVSCSQEYGNGGWWFNSCHRAYPNGLFPSKDEGSNGRFMLWYSASSHLTLSQVRMMVQVWSS